MIDLLMPPPDVARNLLGMTLTSHVDGGIVRLRITETEAYAGHEDPASHAYRGPSPSNAVMFGPAGHLYVYRSHGLHWCCNVVTGESGTAAAVLLRAGCIVRGNELARERRGSAVPEHRLARGPGNLTQALGITGDEDGHFLLGRDSRLCLEGPASDRCVPMAGPRVGVSSGAEVPWRFWVPGDPSVSAYRRSPRAPNVAETT